MSEPSLALIEPRLRTLLPAVLYAEAWSEPSTQTLIDVFNHLRTLRYILQDYVPRFVADDPATPGKTRAKWQTGALMFTDLAGFTTLVEAHAALGTVGAEALLEMLNIYFATMVEVISKSGGNLLEWTGDAMLVQFPQADSEGLIKAVRAGLRMQRAMQRFAQIESPRGIVELGMRIGIHTGRFLAADVGTPRRMESVLLGQVVQATKLAESSGVVGQVCLTEAAQALLADTFRYTQAEHDGYCLVVDDLADDQLGEYDLLPPRRRAGSGVLFDHSPAALISSIEAAVPLVEQLASYLPSPVLNLVVESAAQRAIPAQFVQLPVIFVNLLGLTNLIDQVADSAESDVVQVLAHCFALVNAAVEARGGILKNLTYDKIGSTILIYFGAVNGHVDDVERAAQTALAIKAVIARMAEVQVGALRAAVSCKIGVAYGPAFAAEIGEPRGRREFNLLGDAVNTAARLMAAAAAGEIYINAAFHERIDAAHRCAALGTLQLKGKAEPQSAYRLLS